MLKGSVQRSPFRSNAVQSQYCNNISPGTWYMAILFNLVIFDESGDSGDYCKYGDFCESGDSGHSGDSDESGDFE